MITVARYLLWLAFFVAMPAAADAGVIVTVGNLSIPAGGEGHVDVTISSNSGDSMNVFFDTFFVSGPGLQFATGSGEPDDLQLMNPSYVFPLTDSGAAANPPAGAISSTNFPNDTYSGADATLDGADIIIPSTGALLVTLNVQATTAQPGEVFTIGLDPSTSSFIDSQFNSLTFTGIPGTIEITGSTSVPEPTSGGLFLMGLGTMMAGGTARRRRTRNC